MWFKNRVVVPGEVIYEIVASDDNVDFGVAAADIDISKRHFHGRTEEIYVLLSGALRVRLQRETHGVSRDVCLNSFGASVTIPPGMLHSAKSIGPAPARVLVITKPAWTSEDHHLA